MRNFSIYSVIVVLASAILTWSAVAVPVTKVHVLENLTKEEASLAEKIIEKKGYKLSHQPLFNESKEALVITKSLANENEPASIQIELVRMEDSKKIPVRVYNLKLETKNIAEVLEKFPTPDKLKQSINEQQNSIPVAFQD